MDLNCKFRINELFSRKVFAVFYKNCNLFHGEAMASFFKNTIQIFLGNKLFCHKSGK